MDFWRTFHGPNAGYVIDLYERYRQSPDSLDAAARALFEQWTPPADGISAPAGTSLETLAGAANLAQAIRTIGHLAARLDPLGSAPRGDPLLALEAHGLTADALRRLPASVVGGTAARSASDALDAIEKLRAIYCTTLGYDYDHINIPDERDWLREAAESRRFRPADGPEQARNLLARLTEVEAFEQFLHRVFPGKHRFSIEGLDMLVPMLDELACGAGEAGIPNVLIGMAHRGRLTVLAHVLKKSHAQILAEFKDPVQGRVFRGDLGWTGDVKYHLGAYRVAQGDEPCAVTVSLAPNPSHLEAVNPLISGMARAAGTNTAQRGAPTFDPGVTLPVVIHGDAAFPGQGVVAETLNMATLPGYQVGGVVHIIANNQLGYTTEPQESRSTLYASTLAKGFRIPIVHVNADDPLACLEATRLALAYRARFQRDFVVDLIGYRRYGHNEGDEPGFTQPLLYQIIREHPTVRQLWAETQARRGTLQPDEADTLFRRAQDTLQAEFEQLVPEESLHEAVPEVAPAGTAARVRTSLPLDRLQALNQALLNVPEGFTLHPKLERAMKRRRDDLSDPEARAVDWAWAEQLALAAILEDGIPVRMTGQDVRRGTFSQRHAVFFDYQTGAPYIPMQAIAQAKAAFEIHNSPLTENAAIGFEFGYNIQAPGRLVVWEAQYGDFINGAQVMIDEYLVSGRAKWGLTPSLVLLLPHGYEGAGPDHSSGRLERFLQLTGEKNLRIANCSTAAQYFHLLRRQAILLEIDPLPLIVMTPKSLLRHPLTNSTLRELAEGRWQPVIDDERARARPETIRRLFLCSGKLTVDFAAGGALDDHPEVALARVEQLYPFPEPEVRSLIESYPALEEIVWVQEEPQNMGAWTFAAPLLRSLAGERAVRYVGRAASSSPAEGSAAWHAANQDTLLRQAFELGPDPIADDFIVS